MNKFLKETIKLAYKYPRSLQTVTLHRCTSSSSDQSSQILHEVQGLSKKVVDVPAYEVGFPKASKSAEYKNPEYFCYHNVSFFEAEVEMNKYRLPQPSNKVKN